MINKRYPNKTDMLQIFPELFDEEFVPGTWYYYTKSGDEGSIAYFIDWKDHKYGSQYGLSTIGITSDKCMVESDGWFNRDPGMNRIIKNYRPATAKEVKDTVLAYLERNRFKEGDQVEYKGSIYKLTSMVTVVENNISIVACSASSTLIGIPIVSWGKICLFTMRRIY